MSKIVVGEQEFDVSKAGPMQIAGIARLIARLNLKGRDVLNKEFQAAADDPSSFVWAMLAALDEEDLIDLAALVIGADREFAAEHFDLGWVIEGLAVMIEETDLAGVVANFTRIVSRTAA